MALGARLAASDGGVADLLIALARQEGSATHRYPAQLAARTALARDLADTVHYLCTLYGRSPGVVDLAATRLTPPPVRQWADAAVAGFARERAYLTRVVVAAGPLPSTPGQADSESAVIGQRHALEMLANSDRAGCAPGAAMALVMDWRAIRGVLDSAARRFGLESPACALPSLEATADAAAMLAGEPLVQRALMFGAQQILLQQRGLWDLLEARRQARGDD
jgi:hypothetical protein